MRFAPLLCLLLAGPALADPEDTDVPSEPTTESRGTSLQIGSGGLERPGAPASQAGLGDKPKAPTAQAGEDAQVMGALDRNLIEAVIKRHTAQIRYCYARELTKDPSIQSKVSVHFIIGKDGRVQSGVTKESTLKSPPVESCINARFMRMVFPSPEGGGIVKVTYPFEFTAG